VIYSLVYFLLFVTSVFIRIFVALKGWGIFFSKSFYLRLMA